MKQYILIKGRDNLRRELKLVETVVFYLKGERFPGE